MSGGNSMRGMPGRKPSSSPPSTSGIGYGTRITSASARSVAAATKSPRRTRLSVDEKSTLRLEGQEVVDRLAPSDQPRLTTRDEYGRRARHSVVVRAHPERVGPGRRHCQDISATWLGKLY